MKKLAVVLFAFFLSTGLNAQTKSESLARKSEFVPKTHKIVFQLSSEDTLVHKALMKQLNNISTVAPDSELKVVCQGPGLAMLLKNKSIVQEKIQQLKKKKIEFVACEFSMSEKKITKEQMLPEAGFVKYGILEIVTKQEQGWSYIRSGF